MLLSGWAVMNLTEICAIFQMKVQGKKFQSKIREVCSFSQFFGAFSVPLLGRKFGYEESLGINLLVYSLNFGLKSKETTQLGTLCAQQVHVLNVTTHDGCFD